MNEKQLSYLADVSNNIATVFMASMVVPLLGRAGTMADFKVTITGFFYSLMFWWLGLNLTKEEK